MLAGRLTPEREGFPVDVYCGTCAANANLPRSKRRLLRRSPRPPAGQYTAGRHAGSTAPFPRVAVRFHSHLRQCKKPLLRLVTGFRYYLPQPSHHFDICAHFALCPPRGVPFHAPPPGFRRASTTFYRSCYLPGAWYRCSIARCDPIGQERTNEKKTWSRGGVPSINICKKQEQKISLILDHRRIPFLWRGNRTEALKAKLELRKSSTHDKRSSLLSLPTPAPRRYIAVS